MATEQRLRGSLIGGSLVVSLCLIMVAYTTSGPSIFSAKPAGAESTHDLLATYASKDTDGDGLPDWEEALYGTDPNNPHSVSPSVSDADAVSQGLVQSKFNTATSTPVDTKTLPGVEAAPTTITDQFGRELFGQYLKNRGQNQPSSSDIATFVQQGVTQLKASHQIADSFNQGQVQVSGTGPDALVTYAAAAEKALAKANTGESKYELDYFEDAVYRNDISALAKVQKNADAYAAAGQALMKIPVPMELAPAHLELANALMQVSASVSDMAMLQKDPIRAMLGMGTYADNATRYAKAFYRFGEVYKAEGVTVPTGTTGSYFYKAVTANQQQ